MVIVAAGTTGESGTLSHEEKLLVIKTVIDQTKERVPVIAGTAMNATKDCIALTQQAMEYGAHAVLIMTPAYIDQLKKAYICITVRLLSRSQYLLFYIMFPANSL